MTAVTLMKKPWRVAGWGLVALVLLITAVAMQFSSEVNWGPGDFIAAAGLLALTGLAIELAVMATPSVAKRAIFAVAAIGLLAVVWAEFAVGIF